MTFDEWWDEHWSLLGASEAIRRKEVAKRAWEAATAAERERCAKVAEKAEGGFSCSYRDAHEDGLGSSGYNLACGEIAAAIRSGGEGGRG